MNDASRVQMLLMFLEIAWAEDCQGVALSENAEFVERYMAAYSPHDIIPYEDEDDQNTVEEIESAWLAGELLT